MRNWIAVCYLALLTPASISPIAWSAEPRDPIYVGSEKQLFIDNRFLQNMTGAQLVVNSPRPTGEKLIIAAGPWEKHAVGGYTSVIQEGDRIHMWYETLDLKAQAGVAYAFSVDGGATWSRPELNVVEYEGNRRNNLVIFAAFESHVFLNQPNALPNEKYLMYCGVPNRAYVSPDGIHSRFY